MSTRAARPAVGDLHEHARQATRAAAASSRTTASPLHVTAAAPLLRIATELTPTPADTPQKAESPPGERRAFE